MLTKHVPQLTVISNGSLSWGFEKRLRHTLSQNKEDGFVDEDRSDDDTENGNGEENQSQAVFNGDISV